MFVPDMRVDMPITLASGEMGPDPADVSDGYRDSRTIGAFAANWTKRYVDAAAVSNGDGSKESPHNTIQAAIDAAAGTPTIILLNSRL